MILLYSLFNQITTSHILIWFGRFFASEEKSDRRKKDQMGYWQREQSCVYVQIVIIFSPNKKTPYKKHRILTQHNPFCTGIRAQLSLNGSCPSPCGSHIVFLICILYHHYCCHSHLLEADVANNKAHLGPVFRRNVPWTTSTLGFRKLQRVLRDLCTIASLMSW